MHLGPRDVFRALAERLLLRWDRLALRRAKHVPLESTPIQAKMLVSLVM